MPNAREIAEGKFGVLLRGVSRRHRKDLERLMGDPPDINNVPPEFWERVKRDNEERLLAVMLLLFAGSAEATGKIKRTTTTDTGETIAQRAERYAAERSAFVSDKIVDTTKKNLERVSQKWREMTAKGIPVPKAVIVDATRTQFGDARAQTIATTEVTKARTEGDREGAFVRFGRSVLQVWTLGPCKHCTFCPMVAGTDISCWGQFSEGPPAHVNCCCSIRFLAEGRPIKTCPSSAMIGKSAKDSGLFGL